MKKSSSDITFTQDQDHWRIIQEHIQRPEDGTQYEIGDDLTGEQMRELNFCIGKLADDWMNVRRIQNLQGGKLEIFMPPQPDFYGRQQRLGEILEKVRGRFAKWKKILYIYQNF